VLALLSAAYGRAVAPAVLGNVERAVKSWRDARNASRISTLRIAVRMYRATFEPQRTGYLWPRTQ
jgi:hypothetical protein